ncbi:MAG: heme peroxidase family protein [Actinomycetota bacterium]|nr:heme peroxidase family protein [Actinomycetota bacterium]
MPNQDPSAPAPIPPLHGQKILRGSERVSLSPIHEGVFGRMFRRLSPMPELPLDVLKALAEQMVGEDPAPGGWGTNPTPTDQDNPDLPAGYTYFGQFLDHDITFDPVTSAQRVNDRDALRNFRSPALDLDSVYGSGPIDEPFQYVPDTHGMQMLVETNSRGVEDLPRNSHQTALLGDPRNDENTIIGQLHLAFLRLHNKIAAEVMQDPSVPADAKFEEAQLRVRWHYQWAVVHDFVPRIIGPDLFEKLVERGGPEGRIDNFIRRHYEPRNNPYMPIEFSGAAYRFGHSMIRGVYDLNGDATGVPLFTPGPLQNELQDLRGRRELPAPWTVDWSLFFAAGAAQPSRLINTKLVRALAQIPGGDSLALLNLVKGQLLKLPSGQDVARAMSEEVLRSDELEGAPDPTPLWFYILKEAEKRADGRHLGAVGGRIVGEVLLGLIELDKQSWLNARPTWDPTVPDADGDGIVGIHDLLTFARA